MLFKCKTLCVNRLFSIKIHQADRSVAVVCHPAQIPKDTVLHIWKGTPASYYEELSKMTKAGMRVLLAAPWYINHISYGQDWRDYYTVQPLNFSGVCMAK